MKVAQHSAMCLALLLSVAAYSQTIERRWTHQGNWETFLLRGKDGTRICNTATCSVLTGPQGTKTISLTITPVMSAISIGYEGSKISVSKSVLILADGKPVSESPVFSHFMNDDGKATTLLIGIPNDQFVGQMLP